MGEGKGEGTQDVTKESIIEQTYCSENLPQPLFGKLIVSHKSSAGHREAGYNWFN
jgi:hypothetical protein